MTQDTFRKPRRKDRPVEPYPDPSLISVNTNLASRLSSVSERMATQIPMVAKMLMGANHKIMWCNQLVGNEQIVPKKHRMRIASRTVCKAVLWTCQLYTGWNGT